MSKFSQYSIVLVAVATSLVFGCARPESSPDLSYDGSKFILPSEPNGAQDIIDARSSVEDKAHVVIVGRIGGNKDPWVNDRAAFFLVDSSLKACSDEKEDGEECSCKTPWDYCCATDLASAMTLVKFVESDGSPVKHDAREIFGLTELQTVVVKGTAQCDGDGNLNILADGMFVRK